MAKNIRTTIYLPEDLHDKLKIMAFQRRTSMAKCVIAMVEQAWKENTKVYDRPRIASFINKLVKQHPKAWLEGELRNL